MPASGQGFITKDPAWAIEIGGSVLKILCLPWQHGHKVPIISQVANMYVLIDLFILGLGVELHCGCSFPPPPPPQRNQPN